MTYYLNGFRRAQPVEIRRYLDTDRVGEWEPAVIAKLDADDATLPYAVKYGNSIPDGDGDYDEWVRPDNIRPTGEPSGVRMQFRVAANERSFADDWDYVSEGRVYCGDGIWVEFRSAPVRTDAEILTRIRDRRSEDGCLTDRELRSILNGEF